MLREKESVVSARANHAGGLFPCHCEERSDVAVHTGLSGLCRNREGRAMIRRLPAGLPRFARNDTAWGVPACGGRWIARTE